MENNKESRLIYEESGSREDIGIYLQRVEELKDQNKQPSKKFIKIYLALIILTLISLISIKYINFK
ncbi:hypothetical protein [Mammaliicoccus vitulinus]|uniref:hypothetical protein n=1 Tax=Mammaliicoccus vitulinus TaxID=71237 RepID=UPI003F976A31